MAFQMQAVSGILNWEFIKLGATPEPLDQGNFVWFRYDNLFAIIACFEDYILWGLTAKLISWRKYSIKDQNTNK